MRAKKSLLIGCGVFNIVIGALGTFAGGVLVWMTAAMGSPGEAVFAVPLLAAGVLYAGAGACLLLPVQRGWNIGMALQGTAIMMGMAWAAYFIVALQRNGAKIDPHDEEIVMFVILPAICVLVAIAEFGLIWRLRPRTGSLP